MAVRLQDKPNVAAPTTGFPYGDIKDNPGDNSGTPVNRAVYGDFHQFFARILDVAGITANGLAENFTNGWQYVTAITTMISNAIAATPTPTSGGNATNKTYVDNAVTAEATARANADTTLQNNINAINANSWTNLVLINGWATGASQLPQYRVDSLGRVEFRGCIDATSATADNIATNLPGGTSRTWYMAGVALGGIGSPVAANGYRIIVSSGVATLSYPNSSGIGTPKIFSLDQVKYQI